MCIRARRILRGYGRRELNGSLSVPRSETDKFHLGVEIFRSRKLDTTRPERTIETFENVKEHKEIDSTFTKSFAQKKSSSKLDFLTQKN